MVRLDEVSVAKGIVDRNVPALQYSSGTVYAQTLSGPKILLKDISFSIKKGEKLALIGETGSGKTMIALSLMGRLPGNVKAEGMECFIDGVDVSSPKASNALLGKEVAYIPQNGMEFLNPSRTIRNHIYDSLKRVGVKAEGRKARAEEVLATVGFHHIDDILKSYPFQLSGGMAQRITVALALCTNAKLIIADEPTNGLDQSAASRMMEHLSSLFPEAGKLFITHDIGVASHADKILVLCGGRVMEKGRSSILTEPSNVYTSCLLSALVSNGMKATPTLREKEGCPFSDRCPEFRPQCRTERVHHQNKEHDADHEWWCSR